MRGIKEKITKNLSYINPVSRKLLLGAVIISKFFSPLPSALCCSRDAGSIIGAA